MKSKKKPNEELKLKILEYKKNKLDVSNLISDYELKDLDLSRCILTSFNRINEDLSNINFHASIIGQEGKTTILSGCNLKGSNFMGAKFLGHISFRASDLRNCNFTNAWLPDVEYQYADLRNITICDAAIKFGVKTGLHAKFSWSTFKTLVKYLELDMTT
jgi:uncharacterized protein YjbI with pentapeptide repeats